MKKFAMKPLHHKKSTTYYVTLLLMIGLSFGLGTAILSGGNLISADPTLAITLHESPLVLAHDSEGDHRQTSLGDLLFGREAGAHAYPYCGTGTSWRTIDGVLHKIVYRFTYDNGDHAVRSAHYKYTGTGYTRITDWYYFRVDC